MDLISRYPLLANEEVLHLDGAFVDFEMSQSRTDFGAALNYLEIRAQAMTEFGDVVELGRLSAWRSTSPLDLPLDQVSLRVLAHDMSNGSLEAGAAADALRLRSAEIHLICRDRGIEDLDGAMVIQAIRVRPECRGHRMAIAMMRELKSMLPRQAHLVLIQAMPFVTEFQGLPAERHAAFIEAASSGLSRYYRSAPDLGLIPLADQDSPGLHVAVWAQPSAGERQILHLDLSRRTRTCATRPRLATNLPDFSSRLRRIVAGDTAQPKLRLVN